MTEILTLGFSDAPKKIISFVSLFFYYILRADRIK